MYSGSRFRSSDLWVMSPTRFHCAKPLHCHIYIICKCSLWDSNPRLRREPNLSRSP